MELKIRERFNDDILHEALRRYDIEAENVNALDGFENFIYEYQRNGTPGILRVAHTLRRTPELIHGEADFINHLAAGGASVARALPSARGALVESIPDGADGAFLVTAFAKAPGGLIWHHPGGWTPALYEQYGALLGRMHALARTYTPGDPAWDRGHWDSPLNMDVVRWLPPEDGAVAARFEALLAYLRALPRDAASYGLIHQDVHPYNFFVSPEGTIMVFDFDDCVYSWFIYDIAMVIFYLVAWHDDPVGYAAEFWPHWWRGYCTEYTLDPAWLAEIPHFLKLREIDLYALHHRSFGNPEEVEESDPGAAAYMRERRTRILADVPVIDCDFAALT